MDSARNSVALPTALGRSIEKRNASSLHLPGARETNLNSWRPTMMRPSSTLPFKYARLAYDIDSPVGIAFPPLDMDAKDLFLRKSGNAFPTGSPVLGKIER